MILTLRQGELFLSWQAPLRPNGNVTHYYIRWQPMPIDVEMFDLRDYCSESLADLSHFRSLKIVGNLTH